MKKPYEVFTVTQRVDARGEWTGGDLHYSREGRYDTREEAIEAAKDVAASTPRVCERFDEVERDGSVGTDYFVRVSEHGDAIEDIVCTG